LTRCDILTSSSSAIGDAFTVDGTAWNGQFEIWTAVLVQNSYFRRRALSGKVAG